MAKKNEYGIRNEIVKDFNQEQMDSLIWQRNTMSKMSPEEVYRRIMYLLMEYYIYMEEFGFSDSSQWLKFLDELGRIREQMDDGLFCYSMSERLGGTEVKNLLTQVNNCKVLFGILSYYMIYYIVRSDDPRKDYTIDVMKKLSKWNEIWDNSKWKNSVYKDSNNNSELSYGMRNFYGKAMTMYKKKEFVRFLIDEFDVKDGKENDHEFVKAWANLYVYLWNVYKTNPSKLEELLPKKQATMGEHKYTYYVETKNTHPKEQLVKKAESIPNIAEAMPAETTVQVESTPNLQNTTENKSGAKKQLEERESIVTKIGNFIGEMKESVSSSKHEVSLAEERLADANSRLDATKAAFERAKKALEDSILEQQECEERLKKAKEKENQAMGEYDSLVKLIKIE